MPASEARFFSTVAKKLWLLACIAVLTLVQVVHDGTTTSDAAVLLIYAMGALTFPIGVAYLMLVGGLYEALYSFVGITVSTSRLEMLAVWLGFVLVGYLQWCVVLPAIIRRLKNTNRTGVPG